MKLTTDLILQFEDKDFVGCRLSEVAILDWANKLLEMEMSKWPILDTHNNKAFPNFGRVYTRVMPDSKPDTAEQILKDLLDLQARVAWNLSSPVGLIIGRAQKLFGIK